MYLKQRFCNQYFPTPSVPEQLDSLVLSYCMDYACVKRFAGEREIKLLFQQKDFCHCEKFSLSFYTKSALNRTGQVNLLEHFMGEKLLNRDSYKRKKTCTMKRFFSSCVLFQNPTSLLFGYLVCYPFSAVFECKRYCIEAWQPQNKRCPSDRIMYNDFIQKNWMKLGHFLADDIVNAWELRGILMGAKHWIKQWSCLLYRDP